jgi:hypothetical protein
MAATAFGPAELLGGDGAVRSCRSLDEEGATDKKLTESRC